MVNGNCNICTFGYDSSLSQKVLLNLNESQRAVIMAELCKTQCCHISSVEQIWEPPGTGKTMTVIVLLFILLQMKQRTLTCAPTNVAIVQLASRVLSLVKESYETPTASGECFCSVGDVVLFGNMERLKFSSDIEEIYLDHRVKRLAECLGPVTAWQGSNKKIIIGVISPYAAQVVSIQEKLGHKYEKLDGFSVKVKSIDGFQGGEDIILSTVRSNSHGSVGFISSRQRTNVSLTRARHCFWILGNESTLTDSESIWKELVSDARNRHCLFDADADEYLKMMIIEAKKELQQLDDLVDGNSVLFKQAKWKVWDAVTGTKQYTFEGHEAPVYSVCPHFKGNIQSLG